MAELESNSGFWIPNLSKALLTDNHAIMKINSKSRGSVQRVRHTQLITVL